MYSALGMAGISSVEFKICQKEIVMGMIIANFECYPNLFNNSEIAAMPLLGNWTFNGYVTSQAARYKEIIKMQHKLAASMDRLELKLEESNERSMRIEGMLLENRKKQYEMFRLMSSLVNNRNAPITVREDNEENQLGGGVENLIEIFDSKSSHPPMPSNGNTTSEVSKCCFVKRKNFKYFDLRIFHNKNIPLLQYFQDNEENSEDALIMEFSALRDHIFQKDASLKDMTVSWLEHNGGTSYDRFKNKGKTDINGACRMRNIVKISEYLSCSDDKKYLNEYRFVREKYGIGKDEWKVSINRIIEESLKKITEEYIKMGWLVKRSGSAKNRKRKRESENKLVLNRSTFDKYVKKLKVEVLKIPPESNEK